MLATVIAATSGNVADAGTEGAETDAEREADRLAGLRDVARGLGEDVTNHGVPS